MRARDAVRPLLSIAAATAAIIAVTAAGSPASAGSEPDEPPVATSDGPLGTIPDPAECAAGLTLNDGELVIATGEPAFPPYVIDDDPESGEGFEAAVAYAIAAEMGFGDDDVTWIRTPFDLAFAPGLKDFDFNLQQIDITEERARAVSFSAPYYQATQAIVGPADSPAAEATSLSDLQGLRLGVATGSTSLVFVEEIIVPDEAMQVYNSNADAVAALMADQIDAIVTDLPTALYLAAVELDDGAVFGQFPVTEQTAGAPWGLVFELDNPLVDCANLAILNLRQSGELDAITEEWMTASVDVPFIDIDG